MLLPHLHTLLQRHAKAIETWFSAQYGELSPPFYSSVDVRYAGFKMAPVDTNLFPAGFNNLSPLAREKAVAAFGRWVTAHYDTPPRILLLPERHTRNLHYLENVAVLRDILSHHSAEVRLGSLDDTLDAPLELTSASGQTLVIEPIHRDGNTLVAGSDFVPEMILVNNDLSGGSPAILKRIIQPIHPPVGMGWYRRRKSIHFEAYQQTVKAFSRQFDIDPWHISALFHRCGRIDFRARKGIECVALGVEKVLHRLREKYTEYDIQEEPYVFIKADSGTYGMGIMTARSGEDVMAMNKKGRQKMSVIKEGVESSDVIIQEGVPTVHQVNGGAAEPLMMMLNGEVLGGVWRVHPEKGAGDSLNSPGMRFEPLCEQKAQHDEHCDIEVFGLIARLATLAALHERGIYGEMFFI